MPPPSSSTRWRMPRSPRPSDAGVGGHRRRAARCTMVSVAVSREIVSVTVDRESGACLAMLASDSCVMRYSASPTAGRQPRDRSLGAQRDGQTGAGEIVDQAGDVTAPGSGPSSSARSSSKPTVRRMSAIA